MNLKEIVTNYFSAFPWRKAPFYFNISIFEEMKRRGNTHYCFFCDGLWGYKLDASGRITNCEDRVIRLFHANGCPVCYREVFEDKHLERHVTDSYEHSCHWPDDKDYHEWSEFFAYFNYDIDFVRWCQEKGYKVFRHNPMMDHDPEKHAIAVVKGAEKFDSAKEWLTEDNLPKRFPFKIHCV